MKNQSNISNFKALDDQELYNTSGGLLLLAMSLTIDVLIGLAIYGAFMDGYNDGKKAAG
jgi:lactobin A/cerein 7B family class IIb bacteriocin